MTEPRMLVKICGILQPADALVAVDAGADLVGMVFVPERRRRREISTAQSVVAALRGLDTPPPTVGLFADQPLEDVNRLVHDCELDMVQLCGHESIEYCGQVEVPAIKVLHILPSWEVDYAVGLLSEQIEELSKSGHWVTLDRRVEGLQGGTGQSFNWRIARQLSDQGHRFLLAGGLDPDNVASAVAAAQPWGVDVSTGVETDGDKDPDKVRAFIAAARSASAHAASG